MEQTPSLPTYQIDCMWSILPTHTSPIFASNVKQTSDYQVITIWNELEDYLKKEEKKVEDKVVEEYQIYSSNKIICKKK